MKSMNNQRASRTLSWQTPRYADKRFGFEVTMYCYIAPDAAKIRIAKDAMPRRTVRVGQHLSHYVGGLLLLAGIALAPAIAIADATVYPRLNDWSRYGQNFTNNQTNLLTGLQTTDAVNFQQICKINYVRDGQTSGETNSTSSQPLIVNDVVYWTGFGGFVGATKLLRDASGNISGCQDVWSVRVADILGFDNLDLSAKEPSARVTPAYYVTQDGKGALFYVGPVGAKSFPTPTDLNSLNSSVFAFALDAVSGNVVFKIPVADPAIFNPDNAFVTSTSSPVVYNNVAYFGLSSWNNQFAKPVSFYSPTGYDQTFRGQIIAVDLNGTGNNGTPYVKWRQFTLPKKPANYAATDHWFAGAGVWTSGASLLPGAGKNNQGILYFGSGQLYDYPQFVADCMTKPISPQTFGVASDPNRFTATRQGEIGSGQATCRAQAIKTLAKMGINDPIASSSIMALNVADGSFAWTYPVEGIDAWRGACGQFAVNSANCPVTELAVPGPDWDVGGTAPIVTTVNSRFTVISSSKSGVIFELDALSGQQILKEDVCVGSNVGGIHWGVTYDPVRNNILAGCAGGSWNQFGLFSYASILADGATTCAHGYLNAIDASTGNLKWQAAPAQSDAGTEVCAPVGYVPDLRFKSGVKFDKVLKNKTANVPVYRMPRTNLNGQVTIPNQSPGTAKLQTRPTVAGQLIFMPVYDGAVYLLNASTGQYLNEIDCDRGALYQGVSVTDDTVSFGCGYRYIGLATDEGNNIMVYGLPH